MKTTTTSNQITSTSSQYATDVVYTVKVLLLTAIAILLLIIKGMSADSTAVKQSRNTFYIQFAGKGNDRSLNFEHIFSKGDKMMYSYSVGYAPLGKAYSVPVSLSAITTGKQHHFEMNFAIIPHVEKHTFTKTEDLDKQMFVKASAGYRYQKSAKGLFVRVAAGPQLFMDPPSSNVWSVDPTMLGVSGQIAFGFSF